jgi:hypothetical protein
MQGAIAHQKSGACALCEEAVGPVRVLLEVGRVSTRVATTVLGQKDAIGVVRPARASTANIIWAETCGKPTFTAGATYVFHKTAHGPTVAPRLNP